MKNITLHLLVHPIFHIATQIFMKLYSVPYLYFTSTRENHAGYENDHCPPFRVKIKNEQSFTTTYVHDKVHLCTKVVNIGIPTSICYK
jgi:hypothetical protein